MSEKKKSDLLVSSGSYLYVALVIGVIIIFTALLLSVSDEEVLTGAAVSTGSRVPNTCDNVWTSCSNVKYDDNALATANPTKSGVWRDFGVSIPASSIINRVLIVTDSSISNTKASI